jgi:hypothetical protein
MLPTKRIPIPVQNRTAITAINILLNARKVMRGCLIPSISEKKIKLDTMVIVAANKPGYYNKQQ